jgi:hypothetical protein
MKRINIMMVLFFSTLLNMYPEATPYEISPGTYYILDYPINIRSQPNLQGIVIGKLNLHDEIEVFEAIKSGDFWTDVSLIDGVVQYWYYIKHENIYGYIFGGYIAIKTVVFDIDNNGIDDYFYYRYGSVWGWNYGSDPQLNPGDVFIYINGKRAPNDEIEKAWKHRVVWLDCNLISHAISNGIIILEVEFLQLHSETHELRETSKKTIFIEIDRANVFLN